MEQVFAGNTITVTYDDVTCQHAGACVRRLPSVFDAGREPWIDPDAASAAQIEEAIATCPSGALRAQRR